MIAFVQPFGLADGSGGARILRALLEDAPAPFLSIRTSPKPQPPPPFGSEIRVSPRPSLGRLEGTRWGRYLSHLFNPFSGFLYRRFERRFEATCRTYDVSAIHAIPHGPEFWYAYRVAQRLEVPYVLNVHDDMRYNYAGYDRLEELMECLEEVWAGADGHIVVSDPMGQEYCQRYGERPYIVVTDGLTDDLMADAPRPIPNNRLRVYFMGALHLSYHPNVKALIGALELLQESHPTLDVSLVSRGSSMPIDSSTIPIEHRPYAPEEEVWKDLDEVDVLYMPLPIGEQYDAFTRYSMSTKLVTYLGSGRPLLYHGPSYAAAARLLDHYDAAASVGSLMPEVVASGLLEAKNQYDQIARNALTLGRNRFMLRDQRERFWNLLNTLNDNDYQPGDISHPHGVPQRQV